MSSECVSISPHDPEFNDLKQEVRFGLVVLATDLTSERDLYRLLPSHVSVHVSRVEYENPTTPENLRRMAPRLTQATNLLPPGEALKAIGYSCTAASVAIGDREVASAVGKARPGVPVVTPSGAARVALAALGKRRVALLTPYLEATTRPVVDYFETHGLSICSAHCFGLEDDRKMARISVDSIIDAALTVDCDEADALFLSCTALPAIHAIAEIEERTGKPVVTSNQACAWMMARLGGLHDHNPEGFGRLFDLPLPDATAEAVA